MDAAKVSFLHAVYDYYTGHGRHDLPWRQPEPNGSFDPYKIMVSELMLQQTQVQRVIPKYLEFLRRFPDVQALAAAPLKDVLLAWSGLGYNRRAKYLHQAAQEIVNKGEFPDSVDELMQLPGVGRNTAGAIVVYAFNKPATFVETNIRTVYIHHFFADGSDISDTDIVESLMQTLDSENPREFYWALMDYGSHLKATIGNLNKNSKTYAKQSTFAGSQRQIRGQVLKLLAEGSLSQPLLEKRNHDERLPKVLADLEREGLIQKTGTHYHL